MAESRFLFPQWSARGNKIQWDNKWGLLRMQTKQRSNKKQEKSNFLLKFGYLQHLILFQFSQPFTRSVSSSIYWQTVKHREGSFSYPAISIYLQKYRCVHFWVHISVHVGMWMHKNGESRYIYITEKITGGYKMNSCSCLLCMSERNAER